MPWLYTQDNESMAEENDSKDIAGRITGPLYSAEDDRAIYTDLSFTMRFTLQFSNTRAIK